MLTETQRTPPSCVHIIVPIRNILLMHSSVCDLQEKFRPAIHEFPKVVATTQKLLKASMCSPELPSLLLQGLVPAGALANAY